MACQYIVQELLTVDGAISGVRYVAICTGFKRTLLYQILWKTSKNKLCKYKSLVFHFHYGISGAEIHCSWKSDEKVCNNGISLSCKNKVL